MIVVSDTSPILNLAVVGRLHLLADLYSQIVVPPAVQAELLRNGIQLGPTQLGPTQLGPTWIRVVAAQDRVEVAALQEQLDAGEAEAIVVAGELHAELLLIDERLGRRVATDRGLAVTGLLGVLAEAKVRGFIPHCQPILDEMIEVAGFWIGDELRTRYLRGLDELD